MRRFSTALASLVLFGLLSVSAPAGAAPGSPSAPQDPLLAYFDTIAIPAVKGQPPAEEALKAFYSDRLLPSTRVQVAEDQFIAYWRNVAASHGPGATHTVGADYALSEPMYNEANDEALITTDQTVAVARTPGFQILAILTTIGCAAGGAMCWVSGGNGLTDTMTTYRIVNLRGKWRLDLPAEVVTDMRKLPTKVTATRYAPNASATEGGLTLWASEVALDRDATTVRLAVENATDNDLNLFTAAALATLTDESGKTHGVRALGTFYPDHVPPQSSVEGDLVFEPVPPGTRRLLLAFPNIAVGDRILTLTLEIALAPQR